jgi:hypothetical protein
MAKTIFLALPLHAQSPHDFAAAIGGAASTVSGILNDRVDVIGPPALSDTPLAEALRQQIAKADLLVADISGANPNVMLEVGYAEAMGKPVLLLVRDSADIPSHLRDHRFLIYESSGYSFVATRLTQAIQALLESSGGSPTRQPAPSHVPRTVFISYSHVDEDYFQRILVHLRPLEMAKLIDPWSDKKIRAGDRWREEIRAALDKAVAAVLLISADFLASDFITTDELPPLLDAAEKRGTRIIPVIVKPSGFLRDPRLARFQAVNDAQNPVIRMNEAEREDLYAKLAEIIERDIQAVSAT